PARRSSPPPASPRTEERNMANLSRRGFLKAVGVGAGAVAGTRLAGSSLLGVARAATPDPTSVVVVYLNGGFNAIFTGADAFSGVSLQPINDMKATIEAIAGAQNAPNIADRPNMAKGLAAAQLMSKPTIAKHPSSLVSVDQGLASAIATVSKPIQPFNQQEFN